MPISQHEEKMVNLQKNLRENQQDLQDFLSDMNNWENDIKVKDESLKKTKPINETKLPAVRNSLDKKKRKKTKRVKKETEEKNGQKPPKISGYDYRSWDKFDIDKALEDVDGENETTSSSEYETDEEWEVERKKHLADQEKEKGNEFFRKEEYDKAVECYSHGIELDPTNALLPANRAMALIKQEKYGAAEVDATTAISLDPMYIKAYLRRASCRVGMKKLEEARSDYQRILNLDPQNKTAKLELDKLDKELSRSAAEQPEVKSFTLSESGIVMPVYKSPEQRSKKPLRRIVIEEVGVEEDTSQREAIAKARAKQSEVKQKITQEDEHMFEKFTESASKAKTVTIEEITAESVEQTDPDKSKNGSDKCDETKCSEGKSDQIDTKKQQKGDTDKSKSVTLVPSSASLEDISSKNIPLTSFQFQSDYKVLKHNRQAFYQYFKRIPSTKLPSLFGEMLDSDILVNILTVIRDHFIPANECFEDHLVSLTKVKRFDMTAMFLSKKDKAIVEDLVHHLRKTSASKPDEINKLAKKYGFS